MLTVFRLLQLGEIQVNILMLEDANYSNKEIILPGLHTEKLQSPFILFQ